MKKRSQQIQKNKEKEKEKDNQAAVLVAFFNHDSQNDELMNHWYVDSGASTHMTNRRDILINFRSTEKREILVADKAKMKVS